MADHDQEERRLTQLTPSRPHHQIMSRRLSIQSDQVRRWLFARPISVDDLWNVERPGLGLAHSSPHRLTHVSAVATAASALPHHHSTSINPHASRFTPHVSCLLDVRLAEQLTCTTLCSQPRAVFTSCPGSRRPRPNKGDGRPPAALTRQPLRSAQDSQNVHSRHCNSSDSCSPAR
jgi:hypothetical protein